MTVLVLLPSDTRPWRWLRPADGAEGEGLPAGDARVVAVAPAEAVTLHWAPLPDRSPAQAVAAARLLVGEASAAGTGGLHVAVGDGDGGGDRPIGVVDTATMRQWLDALAAAGIDADAIIPAPMLLPTPGEGHVSAEIGGERVVRGPGSGFADEPGLTELLTGGEPPMPVAPADLVVSIAAALAAPPLDLRQGAFARRRRVEVDWRLIRRLAVLAAAVLALTLGIDLVRLVRLNLAAGAAEAEADALATSGLPRGETVTDPGRQLTERLSRVRGPGRGFTATAAAVYAAVRQVPGSEVTSMSFQSDGSLLVGLATQRESAPTDIKRAIEATGLTVTAGVFQSANGRVAGQFTVGGPAAGGHVNALRLWFAGRSLRERRLVLIAAALALLVLVWGGVLRPLGRRAGERARERQADAVLRLADTRTAVDAIRTAQASRGAAATGAIADVVRASAEEAGFTLASLDPAGPDRVRVGIASARGGALVGWLARLEREGVLVDAAQLTDHGDRTVGVDLTLKARGR